MRFSTQTLFILVFLILTSFNRGTANYHNFAYFSEVGNLIPGGQSIYEDIQAHRLHTIFLGTEIAKIQSGQLPDISISEINLRVNILESRMNYFQEYTTNMEIRSNADYSLPQNLTIQEITYKFGSELSFLQASLIGGKSMSGKKYQKLKAENESKINLINEEIREYTNTYNEDVIILDPAEMPVGPEELNDEEESQITWIEETLSQKKPPVSAAPSAVAEIEKEVPAIELTEIESTPPSIAQLEDIGTVDLDIIQPEIIEEIEIVQENPVIEAAPVIELPDPVATPEIIEEIEIVQENPVIKTAPVIELPEPVATPQIFEEIELVQEEPVIEAAPAIELPEPVVRPEVIEEIEIVQKNPVIKTAPVIELPEPVATPQIFEEIELVQEEPVIEAAPAIELPEPVVRPEVIEEIEIVQKNPDPPIRVAPSIKMDTKQITVKKASEEKPEAVSSEFRFYKSEVFRMQAELERIKKINFVNQKAKDLALKPIKERLELLDKQISGKSENASTNDFIKTIQSEIEKSESLISAYEMSPIMTPIKTPIVAEKTQPQVVNSQRIRYQVQGTEKWHFFYDPGQTQPRNYQVTNMMEILTILETTPGAGVVITGYADKTGNTPNNIALSKKRAEVVKALFTGKGINAERVKIAFLGEASAIRTNDPFARRVEVKMVLNE